MKMKQQHIGLVSKPNTKKRKLGLLTATFIGTVCLLGSVLLSADKAYAAGYHDQKVKAQKSFIKAGSLNKDLNIYTSADSDSSDSDSSSDSDAGFVVNTVSDTDDGQCDQNHCSLREAINAANANPGSDNITFNILPLDGTVKTIGLTSLLPRVSESVTIDGYTQDNAHPRYGSGGIQNETPARILIELDAEPMGPQFDWLAVLTVNGANSTIKGLAMNGLKTKQLPPNEDGVSPAPIHGFMVRLGGEGGHKFVGNYVGIDPTGTFSKGLSIQRGINIIASNITLGGLNPADRNIISGLGIQEDGENPPDQGTTEFGFGRAIQIGDFALPFEPRGDFPGIPEDSEGGAQDNVKVLGNIIGYAADGVTDVRNNANNPIQFIGGNNYVVEGNIVLNQEQGNVWTASIDDETSVQPGHIIRNNHFKNLSGFRTPLAAAATPESPMIIENNIFEGNGIQMSTFAANIILRNNIIDITENMDTEGVAIASPFQLADIFLENIDIENNIIKGGSQGVLLNTVDARISSTGLRNINLEGNTISGAVGAGVQVLGNIAGLSVVGNDINNHGGDGILVTGFDPDIVGSLAQLQAPSLADDMQIRNNRIYGNTGNGVSLYGRFEAVNEQESLIGSTTLNAEPGFTCGIPWEYSCLFFFIDGFPGLGIPEDSAVLFEIGLNAPFNSIEVRNNTGGQDDDLLLLLFEPNPAEGSFSVADNRGSPPEIGYSILNTNNFGTYEVGVKAFGLADVNTTFDLFLTSVDLQQAQTGQPLGAELENNAIYNNGDLGIDLSPLILNPETSVFEFTSDGVTVDAENANGPNGLQNFPELNSAEKQGNKVRVRGSLNSQANTSYRIEVFANTMVDQSGNGEGEYPLGSFVVTTNSNGDVSFNQRIKTKNACSGDSVTATATRLRPDMVGLTSEFSAAVALDDDDSSSESCSRDDASSDSDDSSS